MPVRRVRPQLTLPGGLEPQLPSEHLDGVHLDLDVGAEAPLHLVLLRPTIAVGTVMTASAVKVHAAPRQEPGIELSHPSKDRFGVYLYRGCHVQKNWEGDAGGA